MQSTTEPEDQAHRKISNIALLMTGSELMSGDITDTNSIFISQALSDIGLQVKEKTTVGDDKETLIEQISRLTQENDCLIINGGLGPTEDDLTSEVLAHITGQPLQQNKIATQHIINWCKTRGYEANDANLKQALLPQTAKTFPNAPGSAAAFHLSINQCIVIATPGVPSELRHIMTHQLNDYLNQAMPVKDPQKWQRYCLFGIGESRLQEKINKKLSGIRPYFEIGFRAGLPTLELKIRKKNANNNDAPAFSEQQQNWQEKLTSLISPYYIGPNDTGIAESLVALLQEKNLNISCAESCTGGMIASEITQVAGASNVFPGSIISYSNELKQQFLNVKAKTLETHGAVSQYTAEEMLQGIFDNIHCDYAIAVTGIAGPSGGSEEKPVGTVWIAWGSQQQQHTICLRINVERHTFLKMVTAIALDLIRRQISGEKSMADYIHRWKA